tara:strand:- start:287 stop:1366 length:1080 start_codon:yes stop_codon:yes gene_type:complete
MQFKKKFNKLNKLYIFFFYLILFLNIILITSSGGNSFKIKDLKISEPFNVNFNKEKVINKGFEEAFKELTSMITTSSDQEKIKNLSINQIKSLIDSFNISKERFINDLYIVNFDVNFNKKNTLKLFEKKNIFPSIPKKREILLIPVLVDLQSNQISLFNNNVFYDLWNLKKERFFLLNYILPTEDLEDVNLLLENKNSIEEYDFNKMIEKYNLKDFIIVIIFNNLNEIKILSKIQLNDYLKIETQTFKNENIANDENIVDILKTLKEIYENHWKDINKINTSIKLPLTISLTANNYKKILHFEKVLDDLDLLFSYEVLSFNNKKIYYKLIYNGSPNRFLSDLELRNITVDTQDQEWKIK